MFWHQNWSNIIFGFFFSSYVRSWQSPIWRWRCEGGNLRILLRGGVIFCILHRSFVTPSTADLSCSASEGGFKKVFRFLSCPKILFEMGVRASGSWKSGWNQRPWPPDFDWFRDEFRLRQKGWSWRINSRLLWLPKEDLYSKGIQSGVRRMPQGRTVHRNSWKTWK